MVNTKAKSETKYKKYATGYKSVKDKKNFIYQWSNIMIGWFNIEYLSPLKVIFKGDRHKNIGFNPFNR